MMSLDFIKSFELPPPPLRNFNNEKPISEVGIQRLMKDTLAPDSKGKKFNGISFYSGIRLSEDPTYLDATDQSRDQKLKKKSRAKRALKKKVKEASGKILKNDSRHEKIRHNPLRGKSKNPQQKPTAAPPTEIPKFLNSDQPRPMEVEPSPVKKPEKPQQQPAGAPSMTISNHLGTPLPQPMDQAQPMEIEPPPTVKKPETAAKMPAAVLTDMLLRVTPAPLNWPNMGLVMPGVSASEFRKPEHVPKNLKQLYDWDPSEFRNFDDLSVPSSQPINQETAQKFSELWKKHFPQD